MDTAGNVTTYAGGASGSGYSDGTATAALFNFPVGLAIDTIGNLFVAESANNRIRKIDTGGNVTTYAGSGSVGFSNGVASAAGLASPTAVVIDSSGNLYVTSPNHFRIRKIDTAGNVTTYAGSGTVGYSDGPASGARFNNPQGLVLDSVGNLYVADKHTYTIRKVDTAGNVTTYAGTGVSGGSNGTVTAAKFIGPEGLALDSAGNLFVHDSGSIRKITP